MRIRTATIVATLVWAAAAPARADVQLTMRDGLVSLVAKDATIRQILAEWAKVGQTNIVNLDKVPGGPVTMQLTDVPEEQALDIILRSVTGYLAAPRPTVLTNASRYDRILVMPTSTAPRPSAAPPPPTFPQQPQPQFNPFNTLMQQSDDDQDAQPVVVPGPRGPIFTQFPQPQAPNPQQTGPGSRVFGIPVNPQATQPAPAATPNFKSPSFPTGVAVPGMIVQPPPQPGPPPIVLPFAPPPQH